MANVGSGWAVGALGIAMVALASSGTGAATAAHQPQQYPHQIEMVAISGETVIFEYEQISPGNELFTGNAMSMCLGPNGRQYYLDAMTRTITVLDSENEPIFTFGNEWQDAGLFTISPDGRVYVWETSGDDRFRVFSPDGKYLHDAFVESGGSFRPRSVVWVDNEEFIIGATSLDPGYLGYFAHRMRGEPGDDTHLFRRIGSFIETSDFAPGLYMQIATGHLARNVDGGLLFSALANHRIEKYDADETLAWSVHDPEIFSDAAEHLESTPDGYVRFTRRSGPAALLATDEWVVHTVLHGLEGLESDADLARIDFATVEMPKTVEIIAQNNPDNRLIIPTREDFILSLADDQGRIYGVTDVLTVPNPIRGRLHVTRSSN